MQTTQPVASALRGGGSTSSALGSGGTGGVIALDREGNVSMPFNTEGMYRGTITRSGVVVTGIYGDE